MKTIAKRLIAAVAAMTLLIPSASVWAAKGSTDVDIALGKSATSALWGEKNYLGQYATAVTSEDTGDLFTPCGSPEQVELITIDLGARYPINQIDAYTWGDNSATGYGFGTAENGASFEFYVTNTKPSSKSDDISLKADSKKLSYIGEQQFVAKDGGGFDSRYALSTPDSYRYVQLRFVEGSDAPYDLRIGQINVWTTAEAAANVPTVVSVGKPVYAKYYDGLNHNFQALNDGNVGTSHWVYAYGSKKGSANYGFKLDENGQQIYDSNDKAVLIEGFFDHIIDLEAKYPIEKVIVNQDKVYEGKVDGVQVSNDPSFADAVTLVYDESVGEYYISARDASRYGTDFKYVKVKLTPGVRGNDWMVAIKEVSVYSTSKAAAAATAMADRVNIALGKSVQTNDGGYSKYVAGNAYDGDLSTGWFSFKDIPTLTYDLGSSYPIENIRTYSNSTTYGTKRNRAILSVEVSNDPNFNSDSVVTLSGTQYRIDNSSEKYFTTYSQAVLPSEIGSYRYVRIKGDQSAMGAGNGWQLNEIEIYTSKDAAAWENVSLKSTATFINGGAVAGGSLNALLDGNSSTHCYSGGGMAVIKLPYPMTINQIEVDSRPGYDNLTGNFTNLGGYNIWLSHNPLTGDATASMPAGTVKVSSATRTDQTGVRLYHAGATVVTEVEDETKYSYVTVQCPGNGEFFIYDVRILSNDKITGSTITSELTGEKANGEVLTLTTSWRCETAVDETVNFYIARYDNGALADVQKSEDKTLSGQAGSESFTYTITDDVTGQTKFKGFVWKKGTMDPFAPTAEIEEDGVFWVDPNATTNGDGSKVSPFNSISAARNAIRASGINDDMDSDIVVNLKGGKYRIPDEKNYIVFGSGDGGTNGYNVIYQSAPGEEAVITTGKAITGFTDDNGDGIYEAAASGFDRIYELTVNGVAANLASTEEPITAASIDRNTKTINFNNLPMITKPEDAFVHVASSWMDILLKVTGASEANGLVTLTMDERFAAVTENGALSGHQITKDSKFYIENAKELLDNPGEFYFDKSAKKLYYKPRTGEDMATATVEAALTDSLINISGSEDTPVKNLVLRGIKFVNATYNEMYNYGFTTAQSQIVKFDMNAVAKFVEGSIWVNHAENIEISDCEFTGITKPAISFVQGVVNSKITGNKFYNLGGSAIVVGDDNHEYLDYDNEALCVGNTISDNVIDKPALKMKGSPAIACYYVKDTNIVHNKITECNYTGISLGWGWANYDREGADKENWTVSSNNTVANNYVENVNLVAADGGAVYTLGLLDGTVIEGNYYVQNKIPQQNTGTIGIYTDEGTQNVTITGNVIDMDTVKNIADDGDLYAISAWKSTIKNVNATGNYATFTTVRNNGTNCKIETPTAYTAGSESADVKAIIDASAINLK